MQVERLKGRATDVSSFRPSFLKGREGMLQRRESTLRALHWQRANGQWQSPGPLFCPALPCSVLPTRLSALSESLALPLLLFRGLVWMPQAPNVSGRCSGCAGLPLLDHSTGTANLTPFAGTQPDAKFLPEQTMCQVGPDFILVSVIFGER